MNRYIPVAQPRIGLKEMFYTFRALKEKEISGYSTQHIPKFENEFAKLCDTDYAIAVNSGTSALHLALVALGIQDGDEVLVSAYTNMASFFPILQLGGVPIPVDVDPITFNMDPQDLRRLVSRKTKAIMVVHIFGHPAPMIEICEIAKQYGIPIIEDCAEAHGAMIAGKKVGSFGAIGCFSFYANKLVTTGEGGMLTTSDQNLRDSIKSISSLSFGKHQKFLHERDGYNFRLSNIQAGIGLAQLNRLPAMLRDKRKIVGMYNEYLEGHVNIQTPIELPGYTSVYWMYLIKLKKFSTKTTQKLISKLESKGIEARPGFIPFSDQIHVMKQFEISPRETPIASAAGLSTLYLPSGPSLKKNQIKYIVTNLNNELERVSEEEKLI